MSRNKELDRAFYEIEVKGRLDERWEDFFDAMTVARKEDVTTISGFVADQSALHGLLAMVRDFGLVLVSVKSAAGGEELF